MSSSAELHLAYRVSNAAIQHFPYPHIYVRDVFPPDYYAQMRAMLPAPESMAPIGEVRNAKGFNERFVLQFTPEQLATLTPGQRQFWQELHGWLVGGALAHLLLTKFGPYINQRFGNQAGLRFYDEALLVQDITEYKLGPHTDAPRKVLTLLFYLPGDESQSHLGTSIYLPKDRQLRCPGGPHYEHRGFDRVWTMPFLPNSLFAFVKSDASFHGVEPVKDPDCRRWLLLYDIYHRIEPAGATPGGAPQSPAAS